MVVPNAWRRVLHDALQPQQRMGQIRKTKWKNWVTFGARMPRPTENFRSCTNKSSQNRLWTSFRPSQRTGSSGFEQVNIQPHKVPIAQTRHCNQHHTSSSSTNWRYTAKESFVQKPANPKENLQITECLNAPQNPKYLGKLNFNKKVESKIAN